MPARSSNTRCIVLYVQHLLGSGHLQRTISIARALQQLPDDIEVHVVSGGMPVPTLDLPRLNFHQLPAMRARDDTFSVLVDSNNNPVSQRFLSKRAAELKELALRLNPDLLCIESWPFGRRKLRHELLPLVKALRQQKPETKFVSSVRDLLHSARKIERFEETVDIIENCFDYVLVHADPRFVTLGDSFPLAARIDNKIYYSGFVVNRLSFGKRWHPGGKEVLVAAGGGAAGMTLYRTAVDAARKLPGLIFRILVGRGASQSLFDELSANASANVIVEWARSDYPALLSTCGVSISQAGYNTVMDILAIGCPSILVPFEGSGETEQRMRASRLKRVDPRMRVIVENALNPEKLADAAEELVVKEPHNVGSMPQFDFSGSEHSARMLTNWALHI